MNNFFNEIHSLFTSSLFTPVTNFVTVIVLAFTAHEGFRSARATSEANELSILPLLTLKFVGKPMRDRGITIKNIGYGVAYDIKIEKYLLFITDIQYLWELQLSIKGVNILEQNEEKQLFVKTFQNGKETDVKDFLIFHLDPDEDHERKQTGFFITFKNAKGNEYFLKITTGPNGLSFKIPPRKLNAAGIILMQYSNISTLLVYYFYKILWKFKKPYFAQPKRK